MSGLELTAPRVKNPPVKPYFALTYYVMLYVALHDAISEVVKNEKVGATKP